MGLYSSLKAQLKNKGIEIINEDIYEHIDMWNSWYKGAVEDFHFYNVKLADGSTCECERLSMQMPKKVCEDMSKLLWSEKVQINLDSKEKTDKLWTVLDSKLNNFSVTFPQMLEYTSALGTTALIEYKDGNGELIIDYIKNAQMIIPYEYTNSRITGLIVFNRTISQEKNKKIYYTHLTYHEYKEGKYKKYNELYKSTDENELGKEISFSEMYPDVEEYFEIETDTPYFQVLKFPIANNIDMDTPLGISIFANSIDRFKSIDTKYDSFTNEFELGKKRILVDITSLKGTPNFDEDGNVTQTLYFDKNDKVYVGIRGLDNQPPKEIDMSLRVGEHQDAINSELNWLSSNIGFGESFYSFEGSSLKTATEVMSEDSDAFRTKGAYEIAIKDVVYDLVKVICEIEGIQSNSIEIIMDYSRFKNETAEQQRMERELDKGIISKVEYRMKVYNEDEATATAKIQAIKESEPRIADLVGE